MYISIEVLLYLFVLYIFVFIALRCLCITWANRLQLQNPWCEQWKHHGKTQQMLSANRLTTRIMQPIGFNPRGFIQHFLQKEFCSQLALSMNSQQAWMHPAKRLQPTGLWITSQQAWMHQTQPKGFSQQAFGLPANRLQCTKHSQKAPANRLLDYQPTGFNAPNTAKRLQPTGLQHNKIAIGFIQQHSQASSSPGLWTEHT